MHFSKFDRRADLITLHLRLRDDDYSAIVVRRRTSRNLVMEGEMRSSQTRDTSDEKVGCISGTFLETLI